MIPDIHDGIRYPIIFISVNNGVTEIDIFRDPIYD